MVICIQKLLQNNMRYKNPVASINCWYNKTAGIIQDGTCSFCLSEIEAIEHIVFYCHKSRELLTPQLSSFIFRKINKHTQFDIRNVMFGVFDSSSLSINVIILVTKAYLHMLVIRNERIHILALKNSLQKQFELHCPQKSPNFKF